MTPVGLNNYTVTQKLSQVQPETDKLLNSEKQTSPTSVPATDKLVSLSDEGLAKLSSADKNEQVHHGEERSLGDKVESFMHGTLGLDHPDEIEKKEDDSYTAGQFLKGALTVGGILLAIV